MAAIAERTPERTPAPGADDGALDLDGGLVAALASLPPQQKQAVAYHYLADLPYADVAAIVGGSPDAARRAAADGIAALRRAACEDYHRPPGGDPMSTNDLTRATYQRC